MPTSIPNAGCRSPHDPAAGPFPSLRRLDALAGSRAGARCVVLGNGPSLRDCPLARLAGREIFGVNRGARALDLGLPQLAHLVVSDLQTYTAYAEEIRAAPVASRFYRADVVGCPAYAEALDREDAVAVPFHMTPEMQDGHFATDVRLGLFRGYTVVLDAIQLAYFMGFAEVLVLGVDLTWDGGDTHFYGSGAYERRRIGEMLADRANRGFAVARAAIEAAGRRLWNATPGGRLDALPRVTLEEIAPCGSTPSGSRKGTSPCACS